MTVPEMSGDAPTGRRLYALTPEQRKSRRNEFIERLPTPSEQRKAREDSIQQLKEGHARIEAILQEGAKLKPL